MKKRASDHLWPSTTMLRERCAYWSEFAGGTVYPKVFTTGYCELWFRHKDGTPTRLLTEREVVLVRAVVEWEISKAEGTLRRAA
jgi:hypothetical protein